MLFGFISNKTHACVTLACVTEERTDRLPLLIPTDFLQRAKGNGVHMYFDDTLKGVLL